LFTNKTVLTTFFLSIWRNVTLGLIFTVLYFLQKLTQGREDENKGAYNTRTKREAMRLDSTERIVSIDICIFYYIL